MAIIKKYAEVLPQPLSSFQTFLVDTNPNSTYFRITEFKDTATGGKNGFLIEGTPYLKESTEIKIQILDVNGDPIYYEPGNGVPEYYEGISKIVAFYIYEDTPIGDAKITILGELKTYVDEGGVVRNVPDEWAGVYNVKWEKTFKVNKLLSNEDKVRFYRRPEISITEIVKPIYSNIVTSVTQTGNVHGTPLVPQEGQSVTGYTLPTSYLLTTVGNSFWTGSVTNNYINIPSLGVNLLADDVISDRELTVSTPYNESGIVKSFLNQPYSVTFNHVEALDNLKTALTGSFAKITISDLTTFVGDVARVKIFRRSQSDLSDYQFIQEIQLESNEILRDLESSTKNEEYYGSFDLFNYKNYWSTSSNDITTQFNQNYLYNSVRLDSSYVGEKFFTSKSLEIKSGSEYTLDFNLRQGQNLSADKYFKAYISGSTVINNQDVGKTQNIITITADKTLLEKNSITANFVADEIRDPRLHFEINGSQWYVSDVSLRASQETAFSPDEITFIQPIPRTLPRETFDFKFQFYDINNNYIPVVVEESKTFDGGNLNVINKDLQLIPSSLYFQFDSGSGNGNPIPPTQIFIDVVKSYLTGSVNFTSRSFDFFDVELFNTDYVGAGTQYPGLLLDRNLDTVRLTVENFTGSKIEGRIVQYIEFTGECEGVTDSIVITRVTDGKGGVNHIIRPYRGTQIRNSSTSSLEIQAVRIDGINEIPLSKEAQLNYGLIQLHVLSASLNPAAEPEKFINLALASSSRYVVNLTSGSLGTKQINYNAVFSRESIDTRRTIYLINSASAASDYAYNISGSVLATIILEDLQDGLDTPSVIFNADTFNIDPRNERTFRPSFAFATASFYKRGTTEPITSSFRVFPSMSINKDYVPEYWLYYTTQSTDKTISVVGRDENKNIIDSLPTTAYVGQANKQSKNLTITFTYTEPYTSASISVDKTFSIVPDGKPGDETIIFEVTPTNVALKANAKGVVNSYSSSVTEIRLKQGSRYLKYTASKGEGTFFIVPDKITGKNITPGNIINPQPPGFDKDYTGSLFIGTSKNLNNLSGSVTYEVEIQPYYTSSIYTASIVQNYTKVLDGAPQLEVILNPINPTLIADEVGYVSEYTAADTVLKIKEGDDFLLYNSMSFAPGTFYVEDFSQTDIQTASLNAVYNTDSAFIKFKRFDWPYLSASVDYQIIAYPYSLGPGHQYTSSVFTKTQTFTKSQSVPKQRGVTLSATSNIVNFDKDGLVISPAGNIVLTATATNTTGSVYYQFFKDNVAYTSIQSSNTTTVASGDSTAPGETATWKVKIRDGSNLVGALVRAEAETTIAGIKEGVPSYNAQLTNENSSIIARVSGEVELNGTGTQIIATKGETNLTHVSSFSAQTLDIFGNEVGSLGEYKVTIFSKSSHITLAGGLTAGGTVPTVSGIAQIGNITAWSTPDTNPTATIVYEIDCENGRATLYKTQSLSVVFEGETGPGIVMRDLWNEYEDYIGSYETTNYRRDAVIFPDPSGSSGITHYWAASSGSGPTTYVNPTTSDYYVGGSPPGGYVLIGNQKPTNPLSPSYVSNDYWQYLGQQDFFVAAKIAIFDESYVKNTINVGTYNKTSKFANIVLAGGRPDPYMSIGQHGTVGAAGTSGTTYNPDTSGAAGTSGTGIIGYSRPGIFLGMYEDGANGTTGRFSIKEYGTGGKGMFWDGSTLTIVGSIRQKTPGVPEGRYRGNWASGTTYYEFDVVTYNGASYIVQENEPPHTSTNDTNIDTGYPPNATNTWASYAAQGPGVVYRGDWSLGKTYERTGTRVDVVKGTDGQYWACKLTHNSTTVGATGTPTTGGTYTSYWETYGATFSMVATDFLLAQDVFAVRTIKVGKDSTNPSIELNSDFNNGGKYPFIAVPQGAYTGSSAHDQPGIFLGFFSGSANLSIKSGGGVEKFLKYASGDGTLQIKGTIQATDGEIGNYWKISDSRLYSVAPGNLTSVGQISLQGSRPAIEVYDSGSKLGVDINTNTVLGSVAPVQPPITGSLVSISQINHTTSVGDATSGRNNFVSFTVDVAPISSSVVTDPFNSYRSASFYIPAGFGGQPAIITVTTNGDAYAYAGTDTSTSYITNVYVTERTGVRVSFVPETHTGNIITVADEIYWAQYGDSPNFYGPNATDITMALGNTFTIPISLRNQAGMYNIETYADNFYMTADSQHEPDQPGTHTLSIGNAHSTGTYSTYYGPISPGISSVTVQIPTNKTEIIPGGLQIVSGADRYVRIPRKDSGPMLEVKGGVQFTTNTTSDLGALGDKFNHILATHFGNQASGSSDSAGIYKIWTKLNNGIYLQAGYQLDTANPVTITFPEAFPNKCFAVVCSTDRASGGTLGFNHVQNVSKTGANLYLDSPYDGWWIAVGM